MFLFHTNNITKLITQLRELHSQNELDVDNRDNDERQNSTDFIHSEGTSHTYRSSLDVAVNVVWTLTAVTRINEVIELHEVEEVYVETDTMTFADVISSRVAAVVEIKYGTEQYAQLIELFNEWGLFDN